MEHRNVSLTQNDVKYIHEDRPATTGSITLQIISDNTMIVPTKDLSSLVDIKHTQPTNDFLDIQNTLITTENTSSTTNTQILMIDTSKTDITSQSNQSNSVNFNQKIDKNNKETIDAILARKISSIEVKDGTRPKNKSPISTAVEEEPKWRDIGEFEDLRRTKCRRLYSKLGRSKDLALFYRSGKFYAMEAWCSHMGGPLFEGDIEEHKGSCHVMCPWHAYMFELSTGQSDIGLQQQVYPVKCEGGHVFVEYISPLALYPYL